jgi:hypothetical protein
MARPSLSHPKKSPITSEVLNCLMQSPNSRPEDALLMTELCWWNAGPNHIFFLVPCSKRKWDSSTPMRVGAPYWPMRPLLGKNPYYPPSGNLRGICDSIHMDPYPVNTTSNLGPSNPDIDSQGGWNNVPFVHKMTQGQKKTLMLQQRIAAVIPLRGFGGGPSSNDSPLLRMLLGNRKGKTRTMTPIPTVQITSPMGYTQL